MTMTLAKTLVTAIDAAGYGAMAHDLPDGRTVVAVGTATPTATIMDIGKHVTNHDDFGDVAIAPNAPEFGGFTVYWPGVAWED
jgi:hypothetical protein